MLLRTEHNLKTYKFFISGNVLLVFLDQKWLLVTKTSEGTIGYRVSSAPFKQGHTSAKRRNWDSNPEFGFPYIPTGMFYKVQEMQCRCAFLIAP